MITLPSLYHYSRFEHQGFDQIDNCEFFKAEDLSETETSEKLTGVNVYFVVLIRAQPQVPQNLHVSEILLHKERLSRWLEFGPYLAIETQLRYYNDGLLHK